MRVVTRRSGILGWVLMCGVGVIDPADIGAATLREMAVSWQSSICHIESYGARVGFGTGFLVQTARPGTVLLFTARHVLAGKDSVKVTFGVFDSSGTRESKWGVFDVTKDGRRYYNVSDTLQDCAWMPIGITPLLKVLTPDQSIFGIGQEKFVNSDDLIAGLPVVFVGYPADLSVGDKAPLTRRGSIAGIDAKTKTILLDASAVTGFSGSPVFLDKSQDLCKAVPGVFVGLVFDRKDVNRTYTTQDSSAALIIIPENIGISRVVPAEVLLPSIRLYEEQPK